MKQNGTEFKIKLMDRKVNNSHLRKKWNKTQLTRNKHGEGLTPCDAILNKPVPRTPLTGRALKGFHVEDSYTKPRTLCFNIRHNTLIA